MMKKRFLLCLIGCILIIGMGCVFLYTGIFAAKNDKAQTGTLFVNGKEISNEEIKFDNEYAELPLVKVLTGFGSNVEWLDNDTADIVYKGRKYSLNLKDNSLEEEENSFNLLMPPPGSTYYYCKAANREIFVDSHIIVVIMYIMGEKIDINIDYDNSIVYITERKE
jgi:hypothetical protein